MTEVREANDNNTVRRVMVSRFERERGKKRQHRTIAEKLRKYEGAIEAYEFVPEMMHLLKRYCADLPESQKNEVDFAVAKALNTIPEVGNILEEAVKKHEDIPYELKQRAFSPKYLDADIKQPIASQTVATTSRIAIDPPPVPPHKYEIIFSHLYCVDESDPEWSGSDEPYVVFGVITEAMARQGSPAWAFKTPVYEDVDDGDRRPETGDQNLRLYGYTAPQPIDSPILITATCMENDWGNPEEITSKVRSGLTAAAAKVIATGNPWLIATVPIAYGITYLVDLIAGDDQISSTQQLSVTEAYADGLTSGANPRWLPVMGFDGGDDDGVYGVYLKLIRR
jgi:hypothetical protein